MERGVITQLSSRSSPPTTGDMWIRESDPRAYADAVRAVLTELGLFDLSGAVSLGIASQRSSFLLFDAVSGAPATPLISWQDRRAAAWCANHLPEGISKTGLRLSPHYVGPKLAHLFELDPSLRRAADQGALRFGTLETWLLWIASGGQVHRTDRTMASRTLLYDLWTGDYSTDLLSAFGVPRSLLPELIDGPAIVPDFAIPGDPADRHDVQVTRSDPAPTRHTRGLTVSVTTIADQPSGAYATFGDASGDALVNFGTGTFVLAPIGPTPLLIEGLLSAPLPITLPTSLPTRLQGGHYMLEGTINAGGAVADRFLPGPTPATQPDARPGAPTGRGRLLCLPDDAGVGAPHWRADGSLAFSDSPDERDPATLRRAVIHGLAHRTREIIERLPKAPRRILVAGGLTRDPYVPRALAAILMCPVTVLEEAEVTLLGAASLAEGVPPRPLGVRERVGPDPALAHLAKEHGQWRDFVTAALRGRDPK